MLTGKKTYLVGGGMVLGSIAGWMTGHLTPTDAIMNGLSGLAFIFLRNGISSK